jgi:hypothetical protein
LCEYRPSGETFHDMDLNANEPLSKVVFNYHHPPFSFFKNVRVYLPERELHELTLYLVVTVLSIKQRQTLFAVFNFS